jgi:L-ribulose-5-phosphate 3-epimerase
MLQNRRKFISTIAAAGAAIPFTSELKTFLPYHSEGGFPVRLFSKPLDRYEFGFMCECAAASGIGGFELTVRPGGKVEPVRVENDLPKLVEEAKKFKLSADMIVTGILSASDPSAERILRTASASGIKHYRLGWLDYDLKLDIWDSILKHRDSLKGIADLNQKYGIHGGYQNHSGAMVGSPVWDLHELLLGISPEFLGIQYDVRHAIVEGANSWIIGLRLIASHIRTLAIKDFIWSKVDGKIQAETVPLGEGMVDWDLYFKTVKELNISGPVTLHVEYPLLEKGEDKLTLSKQQDIIIRKLKKDMDYLNGCLNKYGLA